MVVSMPAMATDSLPTDMVMDSTERGLLMLNQRPRPSHGMDMVVSMPAMATDSLPTDMVMDSTERGLLMLSQRPRLSHGTDMVASMAMDSQLMVPMVLTPTASNYQTI